MQLRRKGISFLKIDIICISHIHGDHLFGLFGLLSTMGMLGRTSDLHIYAPRSFAPILKFFLSYFGEGMRFHIEHHVLSMKVPETVFDTKILELSAFPLNHRIDTYGFMVREKEPMLNVRKDAIEKYGLSVAEIAALKRGEDVLRPAGADEPCAENGFTRCSGTDEELIISNADVAYLPYHPRSYAYCSDTAPFPELSEWIRGVDLLYHECTFPESMAEMAAGTYHSTTLQAAACARDAGVKKLVVGHYSSRFPDVKPFLDEIRTVFPDASLGHEGDVFEIPLR